MSEEHERIWLEPSGAPDRCWCQDNQWGEEGVEYVLASTLESLQRENEALKNLIDGDNCADPDKIDALFRRAEAAEAEVKRITESRDGYVKQRDQFQKLYDDERASCILEAKLATDMAADCNDAQARAETAESCLTQLRKAVGELLDQAEHVCLGAHTPADIKEAARNLATPIKNVRTALSAQVQDVAGWQPIEIAPKDGSDVLLSSPNWHGDVVVGCWSFEGWRDREDSDKLDPTHWQPLPAAPSTADTTNPPALSE